MIHAILIVMSIWVFGAIIVGLIIGGMAKDETCILCGNTLSQCAEGGHCV